MRFLLIGVMLITSCTSTLEHPVVLEGNKSNTLNGMGYVFFTQSPISEEFLQSECTRGKKVLEIGAGFGDLPILALENGVDEYHANDISDLHLKILLDKIKLKIPNKSSRLKVLYGRAPDILINLDQKFDAIIADKVIHFFTPEEINEFFRLTKILLKKGGKLHITVASPYSKRYENLPNEYKKKEELGEKFSGYFTNIMNNLKQSEANDKNYQDYKVPNHMVLFAKDDLIKLVESSGTNVEKSYSLQIPTFEVKDWAICSDEQSNIVGVVAVK